MGIIDARTLATNILLSAYGRDEVDIELINTAVQTIFDMGYAHGMTEALKQVLAVKGEDVNEATQI